MAVGLARGGVERTPFLVVKNGRRDLHEVGHRDAVFARETRPAPGLPPVGRPAHHDRAAVGAPVEGQSDVVGDAIGVEQGDGITPARRNVTIGPAGDGDDPVIPGVAAVLGAVKARRSVAQAVVVGTGDQVLRVARIDRDYRLVVRKVAAVLVDTDVAKRGAILLLIRRVNLDIGALGKLDRAGNLSDMLVDVLGERRGPFRSKVRGDPNRNRQHGDGRDDEADATSHGRTAKHCFPP